MKKYVLIIPDGAGDVLRRNGQSPLVEARTPYSDLIAREGFGGRMQTLYPDLSKGSLVAQLGMLGWDPYRYCPAGRSACELLAIDGAYLQDADLAFRANFVVMDGNRLVSYNAHLIESAEAVPLVNKVRAATHSYFPRFDLHHSSDFRNTLVLRGTGVDPALLSCPEPHESEGQELDIRHLVQGADAASREVADSINRFLVFVQWLLRSERANMMLPWGAAQAFSLPSFQEVSSIEGRSAIIGNMDFLRGIAKAGRMDFVARGSGRPDTDYRGKGEAVIELLEADYEFLVCHINGPDEAAHMGDVDLKVRCIERIDEEITRRVVEYFQRRPEELGAVMVVPDHYTNQLSHDPDAPRAEAHSLHPVPFAIWNGEERDEMRFFGEDEAMRGRYGAEPINHLRLLEMMGAARPVASAGC